VGLYRKDGKHPDVFLTDNVPSSNQRFYKWEYMAHWMEAQNENNLKVDEKLTYLTKLHRKLNARQRGETMKVNERLDMLEEITEANEKRGVETEKGFAMLDARTQDITRFLDDHQQARDHLAEKIEYLTSMNDHIIQQLKESETARGALTEQIDDLTSIQKQLAGQIENSKNQQEKVLKKLDNHEAMLEKLSRQMSQLRSTVYERIHFLQEKIENSYELTANYVYHLLSGSHQSFMMEVPHDHQDKMKKES